jgi:hypothetical protein
VVQTHLVARLLGVRLLSVDGVVHLAPARLAPMDPVAPVRGAIPPTGERPALGGGLVRAAQLVEDGDRRLR